MTNNTLANIAVITQYTLRESLKNRILWIAVVFAIIGVGGASFTGDYAIIETRRTEAAFLASFYRFCAVFAMMILVISTIVREFNDKCLELYLSLPISRVIYFAGKLLGFFITGVAVAAVYAAVALFYADATAVLFWFFSLTCELIIIVAICFFCVMTFNQQMPASVVTAFFFYLLSRISDDIVLLSQSEVILHTPGVAYLKQLSEWLAAALPSLGRFTQSEWLIYNNPDVGALAPLIIAQTLIYVALLSGATLFDFTRKNL